MAYREKATDSAKQDYDFSDKVDTEQDADLSDKVTPPWEHTGEPHNTCPCKSIRKGYRVSHAIYYRSGYKDHIIKLQDSKEYPEETHIVGCSCINQPTALDIASESTMLVADLSDSALALFLVDSCGVCNLPDCISSRLPDERYSTTDSNQDYFKSAGITCPVCEGPVDKIHPNGTFTHDRFGPGMCGCQITQEAFLRWRKQPSVFSVPEMCILRKRDEYETENGYRWQMA